MSEEKESLEMLQLEQRALTAEKATIELQSQLMQIKHNEIMSQLISVTSRIQKIEKAKEKEAEENENEAKR